MATLTIVVTRAMKENGSARPGLYEARLQGNARLLCRSCEPFLNAARVLASEGHDLATVIVMRHAGSDTDCLRATIGAAASLNVEENDRPPRFRPWKARPSGALPSRIGANDNPLATLPASLSTAVSRRAA